VGDTGLEPTPENTGKTAFSETGGASGGANAFKAIAEALATLPPDRLAALLAAAVHPQPAAK